MFKEGDNGDLTCYRPNAILPCFSKILEKPINTQLIDHLETHNILHLPQSSFRSGHITATLKVVNDIVCAIDEKIAVFVDLVNSFDSVDPSILLRRLRNISVSEN